MVYRLLVVGRISDCQISLGPDGMAPIFPVGAGPVLALLLYQIIFRRGRKRQRRKPEPGYGRGDVLAGAGFGILSARRKAG